MRSGLVKNAEPILGSVSFETSYDFEDGIEFYVNWTAEIEVRGPIYNFGGIRTQSTSKKERSYFRLIGDSSFDLDEFITDILKISSEAETPGNPTEDSSDIVENAGGSPEGVVKG